MHKAFIRIGRKILNVNQICTMYFDEPLERLHIYTTDGSSRTLEGDEAKNVWTYFSSAIMSFNITPAKEHSVLGEK